MKEEIRRNAIARIRAGEPLFPQVMGYEDTVVPQLENALIAGHDIVFLHEIQSGPASKSYGIQVARLAGMPAAVLNQARHTLDALELQATAAQAQVDLFAAPPAAETIAASALDLRLAALNPDAMSPRDALEALYQLKALASAAPLG